MFKKPVSVASQHKLKSSDVKKLRKDVLEAFPLLTEAEARVLVPSRSEWSVLKIGQPRSLVFANQEGTPMFFELEHEGLFPTVYALWMAPNMLPKIYTYSEVSPRVLAGADLMLPGVIIPEGGLGEFEENDKCACAIPENDLPFAVGCRGSSSDKIKETGMKGTGLRLLHNFSDQLWSMGKRNTPDTSFTINRIFPRESAPDPVVEEEKDVSSNGVEEDGACNDLANLELGDDQQVDDVPDVSTPEGMDQMLEQCLVRALHEKVIDKDLPMRLDAFYSNCLLAVRPPGIQIDTKKSSYKKLPKFFMSYEKKGLIQTKIIHKAEQLVGVNREHELYITYKAESEAAGHTSSTVSADTQGSPKGKISIIPMWKVSSYLRPIFGEQAQLEKDRLYSKEEVREYLKKYASENGLTTGEEVKSVALDELLHGGLFGKKEPESTGDVVDFERLSNRLVNKMQLHHKVVIRGIPGVNDKEVLKKGAMKNIFIQVEDRHTGRKFITRISQLESFGLDPDEFGKALQHKFKTNASVQKLPGKNETGKEISIQGNVLNELKDFLTLECGIPEQFIDMESKCK